MKRFWWVAVLTALAVSAGQALADGGPGVAMGQEYQRFGTFVTWSE